MTELSVVLVVSPVVARCVLVNKGIAKLLSVSLSSFSAFVKSTQNFKRLKAIDHNGKDGRCTFYQTISIPIWMGSLPFIISSAACLSNVFPAAFCTFANNTSFLFRHGITNSLAGSLDLELSNIL